MQDPTGAYVFAAFFAGMFGWLIVTIVRDAIVLPLYYAADNLIFKLRHPEYFRD